MKQIMLVLALSIAAFGTIAQCDKKLLLTSSKTEFLDSADNVQRSVDETTTVEISKPQIIITPGGNPMNGTIKSDSCKWKVPFKEGKMVLKATITDGSGDTKDVTLTIEGKDGKISFLAQVDNEPNQRIRLSVDSFEEKK